MRQQVVAQALRVSRWLAVAPVLLGLNLLLIGLYLADGVDSGDSINLAMQCLLLVVPIGALILNRRLRRTRAANADQIG